MSQEQPAKTLRYYIILECAEFVQRELILYWSLVSP